MKQKIKEIISIAAQTAFEKGELASPHMPEIEIEEPKFENHGDFSTNIAMVSASVQKAAPRKIAEAIVKHINDVDKILTKVDIAGPGFINFFIRPSAWHPLLKKINEQDGLFGSSDKGKGKKVQVEFVSANPTGPLHVGHGRGAAVGDALANILSFCGYDVKREYYINDSGRQINTLGRSVYLRYKELSGDEIDFPKDCYQGGYISEIAKDIINNKSECIANSDESEAVYKCARIAAKQILADINRDLISFGINYDMWFSEQTLYETGKVDASIEEFKKNNLIYKKDGALWFKTSDYGDEKDRVVVRSNGETTYFASDIAYHRDKFKRGFDKVIDVWGADHHGYIPRINASIEASGHGKDQFGVILIQLVNLLRDGLPVAMSTRAGEFVTLKDVIDEVGRDASRFIFLTRHHESPLDFDLELAKKKTNDNPVYYVQYVHARISSIIRNSIEKQIMQAEFNENFLSQLTEPEEIQLIKAMASYPEVVATSAESMEPHRITFYLINLASYFHAYYNKHRVLSDEFELTNARLYLVTAVKKVIHNGLSLLGVSSPDKM